MIKPIDTNDEERFIEDSTFQRLIKTLKEVNQKTTHVATLKETIEDEDGLVVRYQLSQSLSEKILEKRVQCEYYTSQIELVQKLILAKRRIMYEVQEKIDKKNNDIVKLTDKTEKLKIQTESNKENKKKDIHVKTVLTRLNSYRKSYLLHELMEVFKIEIDGGPASMQVDRPKRDCRCVLFDTIRGHHLPHVASIQLSPHNELETTTAIGLLIQMLDAISRILEYPLRYPVLSTPTAPQILCPLEDRTATLSGWKKRAEREQFFEGLYWLGKNISQLRCDCGIPTPVADKTLSVLADWIRSVTEGKYVSIYDRPVYNGSSPASLLVNYQPPTQPFQN